MKTLKLHPLIVDIALGLLMLLFSYTAMSKLLEQEMFIFQMKLSPFPMMDKLAPLLAWFLPISELLIVCFLFFKKSRKLGLILSIALLSLFELYILWMLFSGLHLPCTCGGLMAKLSWKGHLAFNAMFILLSFIALRPDRASPNPLHPFQRIFNASRSENRL